jgi:hypothetical protein
MPVVDLFVCCPGAIAGVPPAGWSFCVLVSAMVIATTFASESNQLDLEGRASSDNGGCIFDADDDRESGGGGGGTANDGYTLA